MRFGKISLAAIAAASLVSAPVMAESLSPAAKAVGASKVKRVGANAKAESKLGGGSGVIVAVLAAAAVIGGIVIASGNDENKPKRPLLFQDFALIRRPSGRLFFVLER